MTKAEIYAYNYGKLKVQSEVLARAVSNYIEHDVVARDIAESNLMQIAVDTLKLVLECEEELRK
jgi:hypothetical protein